MAKSNLIMRRKKSTVLVSTQTLQDAIRRANLVVEQMMDSNPNDPRIEAIEQAVQHMSSILNVNPQQLQSDGMQSVSDYMDDAKNPAEAQKLKQEVDMISKAQQEFRGANPVGQPQQVNYVPDSAIASAKSADGGAAFSTDRNEQAEAKAPEVVSVPRLAVRKKKKEADEELPAAAAPAAPVPPAASPVSKTNVIDYIPTEALIKVIEDLPKEEDFAQDKNKQDALIELTNVLKTRPVLPPDVPEGQAPQAGAPAPAAAIPPAAPVPPVAASSKKAGPWIKTNPDPFGKDWVGADQINEEQRKHDDPYARETELNIGKHQSGDKTADLGDHAMGQGDTISSGSGAAVAIGQGGAAESDNPSVAPKAVSTDVSQPKSQTGFGGLNLSSSLEEEKTADDYRIIDYKVTNEGVRPTGGLPSMDEQESDHHNVDFPEGGIEASVQASLNIISAEIAKLKSAAASNGGWATSYKPMEVDEDGGRTPEIAEAHAGLEDNTGIQHPATTAPISLNGQQSLKTAADLSTGKAVKQSESLGNDLKKMYLEAKSLTVVNDTRPVREAVEAIFRAADMFDEATKTLNKQNQQELSEAEAAKIKSENKGKKSSAFGGLALAAGE